jgi:sarcosine oxidase, subunit beta
MTPDDLGVLGAVPGVDGLLVATGFSGHGFMHAPAVGDELVRLAFGRPTEIDLSPLSPSRFAARLQAERYVF